MTRDKASVPLSVMLQQEAEAMEVCVWWCVCGVEGCDATGVRVIGLVLCFAQHRNDSHPPNPNIVAKARLKQLKAAMAKERQARQELAM
jgi:hypothetical protein